MIVASIVFTVVVIVYLQSLVLRCFCVHTKAKICPGLAAAAITHWSLKVCLENLIRKSHSNEKKKKMVWKKLRKWTKNTQHYRIAAAFSNYHHPARLYNRYKLLSAIFSRLRVEKHYNKVVLLFVTAAFSLLPFYTWLLFCGLESFWGRNRQKITTKQCTSYGIFRTERRTIFPSWTLKEISGAFYRSNWRRCSM